MTSKGGSKSKGNCNGEIQGSLRCGFAFGRDDVLFCVGDTEGGEEHEGHPVRDGLLGVSMCGLVRRRGLEPLCLAALPPQGSASANFATSALCTYAGKRE